jgi:hypothetical protein
MAKSEFPRFADAGSHCGAIIDHPWPLTIVFSLYKLTMSTPGPQYFSNSDNVNLINPIFQNVQGDLNQYNGGEL